MEPANLSAVVRGFLLLAAGFVIARLSALGFVRFNTLLGRSSHGHLWRNVVYYVVLTLFVITALRQFGFDLSVVLGAAGVITVAIGFASQTTISNLISGLFLIGEMPFTVGETLLVNNVQGEVVAVNLLSTLLKTPENSLVRIPNEMLFKIQFVNLTRLPIRRFDCSLQVIFSEDLNKIKNILLEVAQANALCLKAPAPYMEVIGFDNRGVKIMLYAWGKQTSFGELKSTLFVEIQQAFNKHRVQVPATQPLTIATLQSTQNDIIQ